MQVSNMSTDTKKLTQSLLLHRHGPNFRRIVVPFLDSSSSKSIGHGRSDLHHPLVMSFPYLVEPEMTTVKTLVGSNFVAAYRDEQNEEGEVPMMILTHSLDDLVPSPSLRVTFWWQEKKGRQLNVSVFVLQHHYLLSQFVHGLDSHIAVEVGVISTMHHILCIAVEHCLENPPMQKPPNHDRQVRLVAGVSNDVIASVYVDVKENGVGFVSVANEDGDDSPEETLHNIVGVAGTVA